MITIHQFKKLSIEAQLIELNQNAVSLDIFSGPNGEDVALFSINDFYTELFVSPFRDEILKVQCFQSPKKLNWYLQQINIDEIKELVAIS